MRKAQQREILDILKTLEEAHGEIRNLLRQDMQGSQSIQNMLCECQESAISLGGSIEKLEGEGHKTVACLEEYCELLFKISEEIKSGGINPNRIHKSLNRQLIRIGNSAKNDIRIKKEVVFLPYKASMWDSMESVWMEADKDEDCDAYVVAIPYYERNRDGSLGTMHYEGGEYPDYVPVTDWQSYKIEERKPDAAYIQNPYDDRNYVTCVHPRYFSRALKKSVETLVYLPYFVGIGGHVDEHFCTAPGVMNADRVVVESEEVKKTYIESIRKYERENNCRGIFGNLDGKFTVRESPKLERIRRVMESGNIEIPEKWRAKIYKADGTKRKVILYNTTIDALLKHSGTYMEKLESVLDIFRKEKGDFALLWRPHPLLVSTIKSMRPDLYREYMEIVKKYQGEEWGIYDESADIDRAIVLSDAYYGDWSSVVEMYKVTGKPIMIQNAELPGATA